MAFRRGLMLGLSIAAGLFLMAFVSAPADWRVDHSLSAP
jgi:hypothetical protein